MTTTAPEATPQTAQLEENLPLTTAAPAEGSVWQRLAAPFPKTQVEKLPKPVKRGDEDKGRCEDTQQNRKYSADGHFCGGWHTRSMHLDYVGHAGVTMRLNEVVGPDQWSWEPAYMEPTPLQAKLLEQAVVGGNPEVIDRVLSLIATQGVPRGDTEGMWIKFTVNGVTKLAFGEMTGKRGPEAIKGLIGDAIKNGAMRFGVATYLWSKSEDSVELRSYEPTAALPGATEVQEAIGKALQHAQPEPALRSVHSRFGAEVLSKVMLTVDGEPVAALEVMTEHLKRLHAIAQQEAAAAPESAQQPASERPAPAQDERAQSAREQVTQQLQQQMVPDDTSSDQPMSRPAEQEGQEGQEGRPPARSGAAAAAEPWLNEAATMAAILAVPAPQFVAPLLEERKKTHPRELNVQMWRSWLPGQRDAVVARLREQGKSQHADRYQEAAADKSKAVDLKAILEQPPF